MKSLAGNYSCKLVERHNSMRHAPEKRLSFLAAQGKSWGLKTRVAGNKSERSTGVNT
jgi:hypothetical protein